PSMNISRRATTDATLTDPASIFVPIVSSTFSSPSAHSRGVSLYLRVSVDRTAVARHSEDPSIGGGKSWKRAEVFSVLGLSDQAIHDAHRHRGLLADRHGLAGRRSTIVTGPHH